MKRTAILTIGSAISLIFIKTPHLDYNIIMSLIKIKYLTFSNKFS